MLGIVLPDIYLTPTHVLLPKLGTDYSVLRPTVTNTLVIVYDGHKVQKRKVKHVSGIIYGYLLHQCA